MSSSSVKVIAAMGALNAAAMPAAIPTDAIRLQFVGLRRAARARRLLTPAQMLSRIGQRFDLLVGRGRGAAPRHGSLRAALDWSYQFLSPELQRFFARLSVFRGGWTLADAEAVCEEPAALDALVPK